MSESENIVRCRNYSMFSLSISMIFNWSPKIHFICGNCKCYDNGRIKVSNVMKDKPYIICSNCATINEIPITI